METFLDTGRMVLRRFAETDLDHLVGLDGDPEVMRFITGGRPTPRERVEAEILPRILADYDRTDGYGIWAAIEKATGEFLGWFELRPRPGDAPGEVELGYRLRRSAWGSGYATEGSLALIRKGFTDLRVERVYAETMAVNAASRRVMEKCGLRHVRTYHAEFDDPIPGTEHGEVVYEVRREEWAARAGGRDS